MSSTGRRDRGTAAPKFCECGDHAFADLTKGYVALVSPEDADVFRYHWSAALGAGGYVIVIRHKSLGRQRYQSVVLAREIVQPGPGLLVDHASRDTLDNRRPNLRVCNHSQNAANAKTCRRNTSGARGVYKQDGRYYASIMVDGKRHRLGGYASVDAAKRAYDEAALRFHGEFARVG